MRILYLFAVLIALFLFESETMQAGFERRDIGARQRAFGGAFVGSADDVWSIYYNPAGLSNLKNIQVALFYSPQTVGLSELSNGALAGMVPTSMGNFGLGVTSYGFDLYKELAFTLSYSRKISEISVGLNLNYQNVNIKNYGSSGAVGFDVGFLVPVHRQVKIGLSATNLSSPTIGESKEQLARTFSVGVSYQPLQEFSLMLDYVKEIQQSASPRFGFEYWLVESVALRAGISDEPTSYSTGIGVRYSMFEVDYAFYTHQDFGLTHQASILFTFDDEE
ncbi:MAG: hypothetical protein HY960_04040 [Ignavibacteriae bacterium]|nr:hypothetical protein [Ignavibacteriota bacterium]